MGGRPCKPDADLIWLWRTLLPDTPLPSCDSPTDGDAVAGENAEPLTESVEDKPPAERR
jgi:hypothetical protein